MEDKWRAGPGYEYFPKPSPRAGYYNDFTIENQLSFNFSGHSCCIIGDMLYAVGGSNNDNFRDRGC